MRNTRIVTLRLRRVTWWIGICLLLLAPLSAARATAEEEDVRTRYTGTFRFVGGQQERAALDRALEKSLKDVSWILRPFVRSRLRDKTSIVPWFTFTFPPGWIRTVVPDHRPALSPDSGKEVDYVLDGETIRMTQRFHGEHLVQGFRAHEGTRVNEYVPADRDTLVLHVTVQSPRLSKPVRYALTYRK